MYPVTPRHPGMGSGAAICYWSLSEIYVSVLVIDVIIYDGNAVI